MDGQLREQTIQGTVAERFRAALECRDFEAVAALFTADALLDANLPSWRLQRQGADAITRQIEEWFSEAPARFVEWRARDTAWGAVVECAEHRAEGGQDVLYRQVSSSSPRATSSRTSPSTAQARGTPRRSSATRGKRRS